jgi:ligand-binding sensor domain-containing protein
MSRSNILALVCCSLAFSVSSAQAEWQTFRVEDGLPNDYILTILEDSSGDLWIGTLGGGVSRTDGVSWTTYTTADGLAGDRVVDIMEDSSGDLWFAFDLYAHGVTRYDGVSWTTYTKADGLPDDYVHAIIEDSSGDIWLGTNAGVCRYDGASWKTYTIPGGVMANVVKVITEARSGVLWFGTYAGAFRYNGANWRNFTKADGLAGDYVSAIMEDSSGNMWFGTRPDLGVGGGVSRYDGVSWTTYTTADGLAYNDVAAITEDSSGDLWFGCWGGASRYDGASWETYHTVDGLGGDNVFAVMEDSSENLWFGTSDGLTRYDGVSWKVYTTADGLASNSVYAILEDRWGSLWFGTAAGVTRYNRVGWQSYTTADGLAEGFVFAILEDSSGNLWFGTSAGVSRYDGVSWKTFTTADGLASNSVRAILEDSSGNLWFGAFGGLSRYDGVNWISYKEADGLADDRVNAILEDSFGMLWFGTWGGGVSRYDGIGWITYKEADGLADNNVFAMLEDRSGNLWFGTMGGVTRYDGVNWVTYKEADGLAYRDVRAILEDRSGNLWFGTEYGGVSRRTGECWTTYTTAHGLFTNSVRAILEDSSGEVWFGNTVHRPDLVAPETVIWPKPPAITTVRRQTIIFTTAFSGTGSLVFSHSLDGSPWSEWSTTNVWEGRDLSEGLHLFKVKARDKVGNVDSTPAVFAFEVDVTLPSPVISFPAHGQVVRDTVSIVGTASDSRFSSYRVEERRLGAESWELLAEAAAPVRDGPLAAWDTSAGPDGTYEIRLSMTDSLGLTGTAVIQATVDNESPWEVETAPALVRSSTGGDVYTREGALHLYFPPRAFPQDTEVDIREVKEGLVPDSLGSSYRATAGYDISWDGGSLAKPGTLELFFAGPRLQPETGTQALYILGADTTWRRLGGTVNADAMTITASLSEPGRYSVYVESGLSYGPEGLSALSITPRAFSPTGGYARREASISFTLGRPGPVTVKIYNRAGRLVREVLPGEPMNAGVNLVSWDGRDRQGNIAEDGVYIVTVEALGSTRTKTLAVVR